MDSASIRDHYWKLSELEQGFGGQQASVRLLSSTWMLASFSGTGLLLQQPNPASAINWSVPVPTLILLISAMSFMGLLVLWIIDQLVFQRLLNSVTLMCLKMEFDNPELPRTRSLFMASAEDIGMGRWIMLFYLVPMVGFTLLSIASFIFLIDVAGVSSLELVALVLIAAQVGLLLFVRYYSKDVPPGRRAEYFGDKGFSAMFRHDGSLDTRRIVANYDPGGADAPTTDHAT